MNHLTFYNWAKTIYLMQSAHPVFLLQSCCFENFGKLDPSDIPLFLEKAFLDLPLNFKGLIAPVTTKALVEIDFVEMDFQENKIAFTSKNLPILSICDIQNPCFKKVEIDGVFEDFYSLEKIDQIKKEMDFMKSISEMSFH
jgi:hypothetical protein